MASLPETLNLHEVISDFNSNSLGPSQSLTVVADGHIEYSLWKSDERQFGHGKTCPNTCACSFTNALLVAGDLLVDGILLVAGDHFDRGTFNDSHDPPKSTSPSQPTSIWSQTAVIAGIHSTRKEFWKTKPQILRK